MTVNAVPMKANGSGHYGPLYYSCFVIHSVPELYRVFLFHELGRKSVIR